MSRNFHSKTDRAEHADHWGNLKMSRGGARPGAGRKPKYPRLSEAVLVEQLRILQVFGASPAEVAAALGVPGVAPVPAAWRLRHRMMASLARLGGADREVLAGALRIVAAELQRRVELACALVDVADPPGEQPAPG